MAETPGGERHGNFVIFELTQGEPVRVDGLCPDCFLPGLWAIPMYSLSESGVTLAATWAGCVNCPAPGKVTKA